MKTVHTRLFPAGQSSRGPRKILYEAGKRALDLAGASAGLAISWPVLLLAAAAIRAEMGPGVIFRQTRPGLLGLPFEILKLRTMRAPAAGERELATDAERLSRLGVALRRTSIDELPEFWNVIRGEMSLVGPRPLLMQYLDRYTPEQARRHEVKPGITGWTQVNGRNANSWDDKFALDIWYVDHRSLSLDLWILLLTVIKVLKREGIGHAGDATMPEFTGTTSTGRRGA